MRQCALSRKHLPTRCLVRFVLSPDNVPVPDLRCKLPGRGMWLSARRSIVREAAKKNVFARSFRKPVKISDDLPALVEKLMRKDALSALSLANKAGLVITGYEKIRAAIGRDRIGWLFHARDASPDGVKRLDRLMKKAMAGQGARQGGGQDGTETPASDQTSPDGILPPLFACEELSLALGRENVIHVAIRKTTHKHHPLPGTMLKLAGYVTEKQGGKKQETDYGE